MQEILNWLKNGYTKFCGDQVNTKAIAHTHTQFQTSASQFELFLSGHMYVLANEATVDDILQLALLLPNSSAVYEQASLETTASIGRKRSWFRWR